MNSKLLARQWSQGFPKFYVSSLSWWYSSRSPRRPDKSMQCRPQALRDDGRDCRDAEKSFIVIDDQELHSLRESLVQFQNRCHVFELKTRVVCSESIYVVSADVDTTDSMNVKMTDDLDVVLSSDICNLSSSLRITAVNQVLLGLDLATLSPMNGTTAIQVANETASRLDRNSRERYSSKVRDVRGRGLHVWILARRLHTI